MGGKFLSVYVDVLGKVLLWGAIFLFILGTVPFGEKPTVIFTLTAGVILLVLMDWQWHFSAKMSRKLIYTFVVGTMIASGLMLIPGAVWVKYLHWDPESAKTSSTAEKLYVLDKAMRDTADEDRAKELDRITDKVTKRKALTAEEKAFVAGARKAGPGEQAAPKAPVTTASPTRGLPNDATDLPRAWNPDGSMTDVTTWPYVNAPHGKDTVMVPTMIGYHIVWDGIGITVYCRYADNHTEVEPCTEGPQVGQYAHNNGQSDVKASYAFAKKGEK
jgi:hypothetical protein